MGAIQIDSLDNMSWTRITREAQKDSLSSGHDSSARLITMTSEIHLGGTKGA